MEKETFEPLEILAQCISIVNMHRQAIEGFESEHGLQQSHLRLLLTLGRMEKEPICQKDIAEKMRITPAAVAVTLKHLSSKDIISKVMSTRDNRYNDVVITEKGRKLIKEAEMIFHSIEAKAFEGFTKEESTSLQHYLERICYNLKPER